MPVVLDVFSHVSPRFGGIGPSVAALASAVVRSDKWRSQLVAICNRDESERHADIPSTVRMVPGDGFRPALDRSLEAPLKEALAGSSVCHVHGMWEAHSLAIGRLAPPLRKPIVTSVHGMLDGWELANKQLKKSVYSFLFARRSLAQSSCLRALSEREAAEYRRYGLTNPIAVVPNGVKAIARVDTTDFLNRYPQIQGKRVVLFLSRVHHKKGILDLLRAWPSVVERHPDAHLLVAGADFANTEKAARLLVAERNLADAVTFCGVLNGEAKLAALSASFLFCLPSYGEGLSIAALEALSIGLPVVLTDACNIAGITETGAGFVTTNNCSALATSLCDGLCLGKDEWQTMSDAARSLARSRYEWGRIGTSMQGVYEWLLGGRRPDCVIS